MNLEQAKRILEISDGDDKAAVKRKYRHLIGKYHPDTAGCESQEHVRRTQEINEAYQLLKSFERIPASKKETKTWQAQLNEEAFCDRNIYLFYSMETEEKPLYYQAARGKYMWDPDEEEFELFLTSIRHASRELLEQTEEKMPYLQKQDILQEENRFRFQAKLFQCLALQFVHPVSTLRKIAQPESKDSQGREIYHFKAFLAAKGSSRIFQALSQLSEGDSLYPESLNGNKIAVADREGKSLGHLSLEDDRLYFCMIPLLKKHLAQVKMTVRKAETSRKQRPCRAKITVSFYFRLEQEAAAFTGNSQNLQIAAVLAEYEKSLQH